MTMDLETVVGETKTAQQAVEEKSATDYVVENED